LTCFSFARIRFEIVIRLTQNRPPPDVAQMCVKPGEIERLRLAGPACLPVPGSVPPELDQPRLARVQFQPELREPAAQLGQEPLSVTLVLEPDDEVVRRAAGRFAGHRACWQRFTYLAWQGIM